MRILLFDNGNPITVTLGNWGYMKADWERIVGGKILWRKITRFSFIKENPFSASDAIFLHFCYLFQEKPSPAIFQSHRHALTNDFCGFREV
ncbi:MAG: hypothetical protein HQM08_02020 [Candidatus Riflebacteria bacterium]|nr:hypothetical protein [Candidatus Riflebacteria bacterium]